VDFSFPRYLLSKKSVDDRALNKDVLSALRAGLRSDSFDITEIGAGIGVMLIRLLEWGIIKHADYLAIDESAENIDYALAWIPRWAESAGMGVERSGKRQLRLFDQERDVHVIFLQADIFDFIKTNPPKSDLLIAHAVLDLLPLPASLPKIFSLTHGLAWLTINFDGVTTFEPAINPNIDELMERLYHQSMDSRSTGGDSKSGQHLFTYFKTLHVNIIAAGSSDWVVNAADGAYRADEKYFLETILHFVEESLRGNRELDPNQFTDWLAKRHDQIESGELVYIAHQMDFLVKPASN